jgi:hypothetical protein
MSRVLWQGMERTLGKFLHSGDLDVIQTRILPVPDYSGVNDLQVPVQG